MTFNDIVANVMDRLNLTSNDALIRVGKRVNEVYREVTTSLGLITSRRVNLAISLDPTDPDTTLPEVEVEGLEKIERILTEAGNRLVEKTYDDLTKIPTKSATPRAFAVKRMNPDSVTIVLDGFPVDPFTLTVEGHVDISDLTDDDEPAFPKSFHDLLEEGAMYMELRKMEKPELAQDAQMRYKEKLSDLRMFIAKSAYLDIAQGLNRSRTRWWRY